MKEFLFCLIIFFLAHPAQILADDDFKVNAAVRYSLNENGETNVVHQIEIKNKKSEVYASDFTLTLDGHDVISPTVLDSSGKKIDFKLESNKEGSLIKVSFNNAVVGKDEIQKFEIKYTNKSLAIKTGEVWEVSIPKLTEEDKFETYDVELVIPKSFGQLAYVSPEPEIQNILEEEINYFFSKEQLTKSGVTIAFGKFQVYSFSITYHLENPVKKTAPFEIAIPPDTAFQKMIYQSIKPSPKDVSIDSDGNWIALYELSANERLDVKLQGYAQIYSQPRPFPASSQETLNLSTKSTKFWPIKEDEIVSLARIYNTPYKIYDFISKNFEYDYERVKPNAERMGALGAINNPKNALCMEFTDIFVALSRANVIPAREINGFAYTENQRLQPLSLVADVLHAWPEYWDSGRKVWMPVDPTWANTSGGVDYYHNFDMKHITFVIHGASDITPFPPGSYKLGPNPQKDVFVNLSRLPEERFSSPEIKVSFEGKLPWLRTKAKIILANPGPIALYDQEVSILYDSIPVHTEKIIAMPPFNKKAIKIDVPLGFFGYKMPDMISIVLGESVEKVPTHKATVVVANLAIFLLVVFIFVIVILYKMGKIRLK